MKLLYCKICDDVFKLDYAMRQCKCGETKGHYLPDGLNVTYSGTAAVPLGFANSTMTKAVKNQPETGQGKEFIAFVIPKQCPTMVKNDPK